MTRRRRNRHTPEQIIRKLQQAGAKSGFNLIARRRDCRAAIVFLLSRNAA